MCPRSSTTSPVRREPSSVRPATRPSWRCPASARCLHPSNRERRSEDERATLHSDLPIDDCARADVPLGGPDHALPQKQSHTRPAKDQASEDNALNRSKWSAPSRTAQGPNGRTLRIQPEGLATELGWIVIAGRVVVVDRRSQGRIGLPRASEVT